MRTSMNLPDGLLEQAKARALAEGTTVTSLVIDGLRARLADRAGGGPHPAALPSRKLGRAAVDLSDRDAVNDVLDADERDTYRDHR